MKGHTQPPKDRLERIRRKGIEGLWIGERSDIFRIDMLEEWREEWGFDKEQAASGSSTLDDD